MRVLEQNLYLSDLTAKAKEKYFEFYGSTKEEMYKNAPEDKCYVATYYKVSENTDKYVDNPLDYTD